jgi:menaquinone-dependent protoporphyrinogen oxidase
MAEVDDPGDYDAVVLGSAIHGGAWLQEATAFMARSLGTLAGRPVWLFSVGMSGALPRPMQSLASRYEPKEIAGYRQAIAVAGHQLFSGVIRPEHWDRRARRRFRLLGCRYGDYRDWDAIDAWADQIVERLSGVEAGPRSRAGSGCPPFPVAELA